MTDLSQMVVILTGASRGVGLAAAELLAQRGASLTLSDADARAVEASVEKLTQSGARAVEGVACDLRRLSDCEQVVSRTRERFGRIDALVHCAGFDRGPRSDPRPLHELEDGDYEQAVGTQLKGTFLMNRAVLRPLVAARSGQIINLAAACGRSGEALDSLYSASQAGVIGLSESMAEEVRPFGVRVQVVIPQAVAEPGDEPVGPRALSPERIAEVIVFCLTLPADASCDKLVVTPFRAGRGRRGRRG